MRSEEITARFQALCSEGRIEEAAQLLHPEYRLYEGGELTVEGSEQATERLRGMREAFADAEQIVEKQTVDDDVVIDRFVFRGHHTGPFFGLEATGNEFSVTGTAISKIIDGKIFEAFIEWDKVGLMHQLGGD